MDEQILDYEAKRIRDMFWDEGYREGFKEGFKKGFSEGFSEGFLEGMTATLVSLVKNVFTDGKISALTSLVQKGFISITTAAEQANMTETDFRQKMEK